MPPISLQPLERASAIRRNSLRRLLLSPRSAAARVGFRLTAWSRAPDRAGRARGQAPIVRASIRSPWSRRRRRRGGCSTSAARARAGLCPRPSRSRLDHGEEPRPPAVHPPVRPRGLHGAVREQGRLRSSRDASGRPVAAGRPRAHRRHLQSVRRATSRSAETRVGQRTDYDRLTVRSRPTARSRRKTPSPTRRALAQVTSYFVTRQGATMRDAGAAAVPATAPTCASDSPGRSTTSASRCLAQSLKNSNIPDPQDLVELARTTCSR